MRIPLVLVWCPYQAAAQRNSVGLTANDTQGECTLPQCSHTPKGAGSHPGGMNSLVLGCRGWQSCSVLNGKWWMVGWMMGSTIQSCSFVISPLLVVVQPLLSRRAPHRLWFLCCGVCWCMQRNHQEWSWDCQLMVELSSGVSEDVGCLSRMYIHVYCIPSVRGTESNQEVVGVFNN